VPGISLGDIGSIVDNSRFFSGNKCNVGLVDFPPKAMLKIGWSDRDRMGRPGQAG